MKSVESDASAARMRSSLMNLIIAALCFIWTPFLFNICCRSNEEPSIDLSEVNTQRKAPTSNGVFVAVLTDAQYADIDSYSYSNTYSALMDRELVEKVMYFGKSRTSITNLSYPYSYQSPTSDVSLFHLVSRLFDVIDYFLSNTSSLWLFRTCGDSFVNAEAFNDLLQEASSEGNPNEDIIIKGACVCKGSLTYLQGGSGFLISRMAAQKILKEKAILMSFVRKGSPDDRVFGRYMNVANISFYQSTSRQILGHMPIGFETVSGVRNSVKSLMPCPDSITSSTKCRLYLQRFKDLAIWHSTHRSRDFPLIADELLSAFPDNVFFYVLRNGPVFCIAKNGTSSHYL